MMEVMINCILIAAAVYLVCGVIFSFFFMSKGLKAIDPDGTHGASVGFKMIILPGVIVFWSVLLKKWANAMEE
jgi:hypothetical protein